jgi:oligopeptide/dipeptide ABC transporter ATP-binding protein
MRSGKVVETGPTTRLLTAPEHPYTRSLLAAVPSLRTDRTKPLAMVTESSA